MGVRWWWSGEGIQPDRHCLNPAEEKWVPRTRKFQRHMPDGVGMRIQENLMVERTKCLGGASLQMLPQQTPSMEILLSCKAIQEIKKSALSWGGKLLLQWGKNGASQKRNFHR